MFAGLWTLAAATSPLAYARPPVLAAALSPIHPADRQGIWQSGIGLLVAQRLFDRPTTRDETLPMVCSETGAVLAFWGRIDNREPLAASLGLTPAAVAVMTDSALVLAAWRHWDEQLPEQLIGDFALAVVDPQRQRVFLARDALGVKPLYYRQDGGVLAFATTAAALKVLQGLPLTPDREWIARHLLQLSMSHDRTAYIEIRKLPPGHCLSVDAQGARRLRQWHHWRDDCPDSTARDPVWVARYREVLEAAIRCRLPSDLAIGTENSGGLDSATVTCLLGRLIGSPGERLHGFSMALSAHEPACILETSQTAGIVHNHVLTALPRDPVDAFAVIDHSLLVLGYPEEHGNGSGHTLFYREAERQQIRTLFSGFGGDEAVTHAAALVPMEMLDSRRWRQLQALMPGNWLSRWLRVLKMVIQRAAHSVRATRPIEPLRLKQIVRESVVTEYRLRAAARDRLNAAAEFRRTNDLIIRHLLRQPYLGTRLENCTLTAAAYGIEYRWPLLDVRLIQQYLSTPSLEKRGPGGLGRYLHRRAVAGVIPARVAEQTGKDMGAVTGHIGTWCSTGAMPEVLARLHPVLEELIDVPRLEALTADATADEAAGKPIDHRFDRQLGTVVTLNRWLWRDHPCQ